ncbi:uncharacterized protein LOC121411499 [Lytechinus variegatus]|uniref:uncharacterized protein LOC121411499 n=1 Tax=Lytechinus variegatus TaxID=7654 RepID=UPI001BB1E850|nr:uncharacterized protein LOC121411499 [Lytechinus variegatus]
MAQKLLCCTDNLLLLPVCGVFMTLLGLVLLIIYLVARGITSSLYLVDAPIPAYLTALLTIAIGVFLIILLKKRHVILVCLTILASVIDLIVCIVHTITAALVSIPFLGSFSVCVLRATSSECQCYILGDGSTNSTVIVPGDETKHYTFQDVKSCGSIEVTLRDFLYTLSIVYSFGAIGCLVSAILSTLILCSNRRSSKDEVEEEVLPSRERSNQQTNQHEEESRGRSSTAQRPLEEATSQGTPVQSGSGNEALLTHQGARSQNSVGRTPERPVRRAASVGRSPERPVRRTASVNSPTRGVTIHEAVTPSSRAGSALRIHTLGPASGESGARQRPRPPLLVRSGYLQSHVNGPRIPVYTVHGSNESYISLVDLPKLQLPALSQVPAYVRELPGLPNYEPPPYSPTAEIPERPDSGGQTIPSPPVRQCLFGEDANSEQNEFQELELQAPMATDPFRAREELGDSADEQIPLETDVSLETSNPPNCVVQENNIDPDPLVSEETNDAILNLAIPETNENSMDAGIANPVFEGEETDIVEDINQPPDILMEAIESARSSLNTSTNIQDASVNSTPQDSRRTASTVRVSGLISNESSTDSQAEVTLRTSEIKQDTRQNPQNDMNRPKRSTRLQHQTTNPQEHSLEPLQRHKGLASDQTRGKSLKTLPINISPDARSREVRRSRSLCASRNPGPDRPLQEIQSSSNKGKRRSETYGRKRNVENGARRKDYWHVGEERSSGLRYKPTTSEIKLIPEIALQRSYDYVRSRRPNVSSGENDISIVEEASSLSAKHSSKKRKKPKESRRTDTQAESRI